MFNEPALKPSSDRDITISLGNLFHCLSFFILKKFFLVSNLILSYLNLKSLLLILLVDTGQLRDILKLITLFAGCVHFPQAPRVTSGDHDRALAPASLPVIQKKLPTSACQNQAPIHLG